MLAMTVAIATDVAAHAKGRYSLRSNAPLRATTHAQRMATGTAASPNRAGRLPLRKNVLTIVAMTMSARTNARSFGSRSSRRRTHQMTSANGMTAQNM